MDFNERLKSDPLGAALPSHFRHLMIRHECAKPLESVFASEPEFSRPRMVSTLGGRMGFMPRFAAPMLLEEARIRGSAEAGVAWLEKVLATESAQGVIAYALWGFKVSERIALTPDIDVMPFEDLPTSPQKTALSQPDTVAGYRTAPTYSFGSPSSVLISPVVIEPYLVDAETDLPTPSLRDHLQEDFESMRHCLALSKRGVVMPGPSWFQYDDPDLAAAVLGGGTTTFRHQEVIPMVVGDEQVMDPTDSAKVAGQFLALPARARNRMRTAMERIHLAFIRSTPADKALELAIALEALLVDSSGEHTFKIALRSALLTSADPKNRAAIRAIIEAAYGLRSALMHTGEASSECKVRGQGKRPATEVATRAIEVGVDVIRGILSDGALPDWNSVELGSSSRMRSESAATHH